MKIRGEIYTFYHFQEWKIEATDNVAFMDALLQGAGLDEHSWVKINDIVEEVLLGFPRMVSERHLGSHLGNEISEFNGPF